MPCASCTTSPTFHDYYSSNIFTWCTNCGNYGINAATKRALVANGVHPHETLLCFDVGCNGNGSDKMAGYRFHGLHGRIISFACGASVANTELTILASAGDGATFGEGIGHLIHGIRGNYNITFLFHNNLNYGLTQGQASPTTKHGMKMTASPDGINSEPVHPMRLVLALPCTFAARTFSGDVKHMTEVIQTGLHHPGISFIEILQSCPTYNKATPHEWYLERTYKVDSTTHNSQDINQARQLAENLEDHIALGVLYQDQHSVPFMSKQANRLERTAQLVNEVAPFDITNLVAAFR